MLFCDECDVGLNPAKNSTIPCINVSIRNVKASSSTVRTRFPVPCHVTLKKKKKKTWDEFRISERHSVCPACPSRKRREEEKNGGGGKQARPYIRAEQRGDTDASGGFSVSRRRPNRQPSNLWLPSQRRVPRLPWVASSRAAFLSVGLIFPGAQSERHSPLRASSSSFSFGRGAKRQQNNGIGTAGERKAVIRHGNKGREVQRCSGKGKKESL